MAKNDHYCEMCDRWVTSTTCPACGMPTRPKLKNPAAVALGSLTSPRKARSSAVNGRLGGRKKKDAEVMDDKKPTE